MAKAKKSESAGGEEAKKPVAANAAPKKLGGKSGSFGGMPLIDTDLAAQSAARMLMARKGGRMASAPAQPASDAAKAETSKFKQLKESLAKPHLTGMDTMLNTTAPAEGHKSNTPFAQQDQRGHNQTFGADVARTGVPRRTAG